MTTLDDVLVLQKTSKILFPPAVVPPFIETKTEIDIVSGTLSIGMPSFSSHVSYFL
jgi:hypothetical protein